MLDTQKIKEPVLHEPCMAERFYGENHYVLFENTILVSFPSVQKRNLFLGNNGSEYEMAKVPEGAEDPYPELYYYCLNLNYS